MRYKNKVYCDCCGKFLNTINEKDMKQVKNIRDMGGRLNCSAVCDSCSKRNEKNLKKKFESEDNS